MNPWIWRIIAVILAIAFLPLIVNGVASLTMNAIDAVGHSINLLLKTLSRPGEARLEGLIRLCLYLVSITFFPPQLALKRVRVIYPQRMLAINTSSRDGSISSI